MFHDKITTHDPLLIHLFSCIKKSPSTTRYQTRRKAKSSSSSPKSISDSLTAQTNISIFLILHYAFPAFLPMLDKLKFRSGTSPLCKVTQGVIAVRLIRKSLPTPPSTKTYRVEIISSQIIAYRHPPQPPRDDHKPRKQTISAQSNPIQQIRVQGPSGNTYDLKPAAVGSRGEALASPRPSSVSSLGRSFVCDLLMADDSEAQIDCAVLMMLGFFLSQPGGRGLRREEEEDGWVGGKGQRKETEGKRRERERRKEARERKNMVKFGLN